MATLLTAAEMQLWRAGYGPPLYDLLRGTLAGKRPAAEALARPAAEALARPAAEALARPAAEALARHVGLLGGIVHGEAAGGLS